MLAEGAGSPPQGIVEAQGYYAAQGEGVVLDMLQIQLVSANGVGDTILDQLLGIVVGKVEHLFGVQLDRVELKLCLDNLL